MSIEIRSRIKPKSKVGRALATLLLVQASAGLAGEGIVNVNQHLTDDAGGNCITPSNCDSASQWSVLPLDVLGQSADLAGNAFHVGTQCQVAKARCVYNPYSKTKILSSDVGNLNPIDVQTWIGQIRQAPHVVGQIHFEHYDACLEAWADAGNAVSDLSRPNSADCTGFGLPSTSPVQMLNWIRDSSGASVAETMLLPNGYLHVLSGSPRSLRWRVWDTVAGAFSDNPKRLVGSGYMGALAAPPERLDVPAYFRTLRSHNSHLIRVWSVEQWVAQAQATTKGATPFLGTLQAHNYDLAVDNPAFYERLRYFAQQAADRGIVVQLSLFDKHGLICQNHQHQYSESPYLFSNNLTNPDFLPNAACSCTHGFGPAPEAPDVVDCQPTLDFVDATNFPALQTYHARYISRVGEEVGGIGNMIFEIINEALAPHAAPRYTPGDWPKPTGNGSTMNQEWQMEMAKQARLSLPLANGTNQLNLVRDAFNGDSNGTLLVSKVSDIEGAAWSATTTNVRIKLPSSGGTETGGLGPTRTLGYATSNAEAGKSIMSATIPFGSTSTWTKLHVRADLTVSSGQAKLGLAAAGNSLGVKLDTALAENQLRVEQIGGCPLLATMCTLGTATISSPRSTHNLRMKVDQVVTPGSWSVSVFLDGAPVPGLQDLVTNPFGTIAEAFFSGTAGVTPYPMDAAMIDNFEAGRFCADMSRGCAP